MAKNSLERHRRGPSATKDERGKVCVQVFMRGPSGQYVKGNISRSLQVRDATVSDIYRKIEAALFPTEEE